MLRTQPKRTQCHFATCHLCDKKKLVWWEQRGVIHPEWIRICGDCQHMIHKNNRRNPKPNNQLDLFAK